MGKIWPSGASHGPGNDFWAKILNKELIPKNKLFDASLNHLGPHQFWKWPKLGVVWGGSGWHETIYFLMEIHSFLGILAQKSFTGPGDAPDGQVLAISGTGVVWGC